MTETPDDLRTEAAGHRLQARDEPGDGMNVQHELSSLKEQLADALEARDQAQAEVARMQRHVGLSELQTPEAEAGACPPPVCSQCGGPHPFDTVIPSPTWNSVVRASGLSDMLCPTCIIAAFVKAGRSFTATLFGDQFSGEAIEVIVGSQKAKEMLAAEEMFIGQAYQRAEQAEAERDALRAENEHLQGDIDARALAELSRWQTMTDKVERLRATLAAVREKGIQWRNAGFQPIQRFGYELLALLDGTAPEDER